MTTKQYKFFAAATLLLTTGTAHAYTFAENSEGESARWAADQVVLRIDPQLVRVLGREQITEAIQAAADQWSGLGGAPVLTVSEWPAGPYSEFSDESAIVYGYGYPWKHELAMTILRYGEHGEIRKATIALNPEYLSSLDYDLRSILTHEMGHVMGLSHSTIEEAVMSGSLQPGEQKHQLTQDDEDGVTALYEQHLRVGAGGCSTNHDAPVTNSTLCQVVLLLMIWRAVTRWQDRR